LSSALVAGTLNVEFSGAAATRDPIASLGNTAWDLIDVPNIGENAIDGNFSNVNPDGTIGVAGLDAAHSAPLGAVYRIKKTTTATNTKLQLSYEQVLILTVNRDTGVMTVRNPYSGNIAIDAYSVTSARGSMNIGYAGLGAATPNAGVWVKPTAPGGNTVNALSEVKEPDSTIPIGNQDAYDLTSVASVALGNGFSKTGVSANIANFGFDGEDLVFEYAGPGNGDNLIRGQVEYIGTKYEVVAVPWSCSSIRTTVGHSSRTNRRRRSRSTATRSSHRPTRSSAPVSAVVWAALGRPARHPRPAPSRRLI